MILNDKYLSKEPGSPRLFAFFIDSQPCKYFSYFDVGLVIRPKINFTSWLLMESILRSEITENQYCILKCPSRGIATLGYNT